MPELQEMLPAITDVEVFGDLEGAEECAFYLYRETATLVGITAHLARTEDEFPFLRDEAILAGLLNRIFKMMKHVLGCLAKHSDADLVEILNRCILESVISLELLSDPGHSYFDEFVESSLVAERGLYNEIHRNIAERGGVILAIEERMLASIDRVAGHSGKQIDEIDTRQGQWAGNFRNRLRLLDKEELYLYFQKLGSHPIHGTWVNLYLSQLLESDSNPGHFRLRSSKPPDARLVTPIATWIVFGLQAILVDRQLAINAQLKPLNDAINDLQTRLLRFEERHEGFFAKA